MYKKYLCCFLVFSFLFLFPACAEKSRDNNRVIIALSADVESLNPLYSFTVNEGMISEILYPGLVKHDWDFESGRLITSPLLAESLQWNEDSSSIKVKLRNDAYWSDGRKITAEDFKISLLLYSHPEVNSRLYGTFKNYILLDDLTIDIEKTITVFDSLTFSIKFNKNSLPSFIDIDMPVIPAHVFGTIPPEEIPRKEKEYNSVTSGAYKLKSWDKNQAIILTADKSSFLINDDSIEEIIFKVVPDYNSRITQLKNKEVDIVEDLNPEDGQMLKNNSDIGISSIEGRVYDYIGWSNIDINEYKKSGRKIPHQIFGSAGVRKALTLAVNRGEIIDEYFLNFAQTASGPVSPIFKKYNNDKITPYPFNPDSSRRLLNNEGWKDEDGDGILEKNNKKFSFSLFIPSGNPARLFASKIIKNNLAAVGVDARIEMLEPGVFFEKMFNREFDAWMAGWSVPIPIELKVYWHSDLNENPLNIPGFNNKEADLLLEKISILNEGEIKNQLVKEFLQLIHIEEPVTFLYWMDNITAYNKRISGIKISPLGIVHHPWEWKLN